jgi:hypothetical protein
MKQVLALLNSVNKPWGKEKPERIKKAVGKVEEIRIQDCSHWHLYKNSSNYTTGIHKYNPFSFRGAP